MCQVICVPGDLPFVETLDLMGTRELSGVGARPTHIHQFFTYINSILASSPLFTVSYVARSLWALSGRCVVVACVLHVCLPAVRIGVVDPSGKLIFNTRSLFK